MFAYLLGKEGQYHCRYLRCAGRVHATKDALKAHVDLSHLSRLEISCPILDCEQEFSRASQLESHFESNHNDIVNTHVTRTFERLVPTASPVRRVMICPPPLPSQRELRLWHFTAPAISLPPLHKSQSPLIPVEPTSRKWTRLEVPDESDGSHDDIPLDDLVHPVILPEDQNEIVLHVRKKPPGPLSENQKLAHPQSMPHPLPLDDRVPRSMGFSIFMEKFEELAKDGVVDGSHV